MKGAWNLRFVLRRLASAPSALLWVVLYAVLWVPTGLVSRLAADWLRRSRPRATQWRARESRLNDPRHLLEGF